MVFINKSCGINILILLPSSHPLTQHIRTATKSVMVEIKLRTKVNRNDYKRLLTLYRDISFERSQPFDPLIPYLIIEFGGTCNETIYCLKRSRQKTRYLFIDIKLEPFDKIEIQTRQNNY